MSEIDELRRLLNTLVPDGMVPSGTVVAYAGEIDDTNGVVEVRKGWLLCNGAAVSHTDFPDLFNAIQSSHGNGSDSDFPKPGASFNLPDLRGLFLRGVNDGRTGPLSDPEHADDRRPQNHMGGNVGNRVGSVQHFATAMPGTAFQTLEETQTHRHPYSDAHFAEVDAGRHGLKGNKGDSDNDNGRHTTNQVTSPNDARHTHRIVGGDAETRPSNAYVHWIIKT